MPWIHTQKIVPPLKTVVVVVENDDTVSERQLEDVEIYDGRGGIRKDAPRFWQHQNGDRTLPIPSTHPKGMAEPEMQEQHFNIKPVFPEARKCEDTSPTSST